MQLAADWPDLLEKDFRTVYFNQYKVLPMMVPDLFNVLKAEGAFEKSTSVGDVPDFAEFTGKVSEVNPKEGLKALFVALVKLSQMLEVPKALFTDKVKIKEMLQWITSRKDSFGGLLDFSMVRVG